MSRFKFGLQRVLELREDAERAAATALADAQRAAEAARAAVAQLESVRDANRERAFQGGTTVGAMRQLAFVIEQAERRVQLAAGASAAADAGVATSQKALQHAFQQRRVLDRLREKSLDAHRAGEVQLDRQTMDDIALGRFGRPGATE